MRRLIHIAICILLLVPAAAFAGEVIDGVIATVNRQARAAKRVGRRRRASKRSCSRSHFATISDRDRVRALQRLIDRRLLEVQMSNRGYLAPSADELRAAVAKLRAQIPGAKDEAGWQTVLAEYAFSQRDIENHLRSETQMMNFVEVRLRPNVHIQPEEVEAYYRSQVLPDLEKAGVKLVTLQEVEPKIRELLVQQHMDELLDAWLHNLRQQTPVHSTVALPGNNEERQDMGGN